MFEVSKKMKDDVGVVVGLERFYDPKGWFSFLPDEFNENFELIREFLGKRENWVIEIVRGVEMGMDELDCVVYLIER